VTTSDRIDVRPTATGARFEARVTPRAGRSAIAGVREGRLLVRVAAAPVDGEANDEVVRTIAAALHTPPRDVRLAAGARGRTKTIDVTGLDAAVVRERLTGATA
jgi:uncharacterized protein (TIGR00251 family)